MAVGVPERLPASRSINARLWGWGRAGVGGRGRACRGGGEREGEPLTVTFAAFAHPVLRRYCVQQSAGWLWVGVGVAVAVGVGVGVAVGVGVGVGVSGSGSGSVDGSGSGCG